MEMRNNLFYGNKAGYGAAIYLEYSNFTSSYIFNNTFLENIANKNGVFKIYKTENIFIDNIIFFEN